MPKRKAKPESIIHMSMNGHTLSGRKAAGGAWEFTCDTWPELAKHFSGDGSLDGMIEAFVQRAIKASATLERFTKPRGE